MRLFIRLAPAALLALTLIACGGDSGGATDVGSIADPGVEVGPVDVLDPGPGEVEDECKCGNGVCQAECGESLETCPCDCKVCEDGLCSPCEGPLSAPTDCCGTCGDGLCMGFDCGENGTVCPQDCGAKCGNGTCEKGENPYACPDDCKWQVCGNGVCEPSDGGFATCPDDCGPDCGDCTCGPSENWMQCPIDCGFCGDHVCSSCPKLLEGDGGCAKDCSTDACTPQSYKFCCGKDVCWFDSCDNAGDVVETCADSCASGACLQVAKAPTLAFASPADDVGKGLATAVVSNLVLGPTGSKDLVVSATQDGQPVPDVQITFVQSGGDGGAVSLLTGTVGTDASGVARAPVQATTGQSGWTQFKACVGGQPATACLRFNVHVAPDGHVPLAVAVPGYEGKYDVSTLSQVYVRVFVQSATAPYACDALLASPGGEPPATEGVVDLLTGTVFFDSIPGLADLGSASLTVLADLVFGTTGAPGGGVARGCVDTGVAVVPAGASTYVEVPVSDGQPSMTKALYWAMTNTIDLYSGLPDPVKKAVDERAALLVDPAGGTLLQFCRVTDGQGVLPNYCKVLFVNPASPDLATLTEAGKAVLSVLTANTTSALQASCPLADKASCASAWFSAGDVTGFLSAVRQTGSLWMTEVPDASGVLPKGSVQLWFDNAMIRWPWGLDCKADDDTCGWFATSLNVFPLWAGLDHLFGDGTLKSDGTFSIATLAWMPWLGAIVSGLLEWIGTRIVGGALEDGWPYVLRTVLGGPGCQATEGCCSSFGGMVQKAYANLSAEVSYGACAMLVELAPAALRQPIAELDLDPTQSTLALPGCPLSDTNGDLAYDTLGSAAQPCAWDARIESTVGTFQPAFTIHALTDQ